MHPPPCSRPVRRDFSLREQLSLVTAAAEAADRELAERELTRNNDEQVIAERDRACADRQS